MNPKYIVSICIPSYNNRSGIVSMVRNLERINNEKVQVVICDDASKDGTQEELKKIENPNFKITFNDQNIGSYQNWNKVLELGDGEFLYLAMGRDYLNISRVHRLIGLLKFFKEHNICIGMDRKYEHGYSEIGRVEAIKYLIGIHHPTGLIIKRDAYRRIRERDGVFDRNTIYPENYIKKEIIKKGIAGIGYSGVFTDRECVNIATVRSGVEKSENIADAYFHPNRRIEEIIDVIKMVREDPELSLKKTEWMGIFNSKVKEGFDYIEVYRDICNRYDWMRHYGYERCHVVMDELKEYGDRFAREISKQGISDEEKQILKDQRDSFMCRIRRVPDEGEIHRMRIKSLLLLRCIELAANDEMQAYCNENSLRNIAIYGFGEVGKAIYWLLKGKNVNVTCFLDREYLYLYSDVDIVSPEADISMADLLIVSLVDYADEIVTQYSGKCKSVLTAEEFLFQVPK